MMAYFLGNWGISFNLGISCVFLWLGSDYAFMAGMLHVWYAYFLEHHNLEAQTDICPLVVKSFGKVLSVSQLYGYFVILYYKLI